MKLLFSFKGKIGRGKFFGIGILYMIASLIIVASTSDIVGILASLLYVYINFTLAVKRLHDIDLSPWYVLLYFAPFAGIILYLYLLFKKGKKVVERVEKPIIRNEEVDKDEPVATLNEIQKNVFRILKDSMS